MAAAADAAIPAAAAGAAAAPAAEGAERGSHWLQLVDRMRGAMGDDALRKMGKLNVLLYGLGSLGVEIAKNLILTGPASVTLVDSKPTTLFDTGLNYYLTAEHVGQPRAAACAGQLAGLNPYVTVRVAPGLTEELVATHQVLVMTDAPRAEQLRWNTFCRELGAGAGAAAGAGGEGEEEGEGAGAGKGKARGPVFIAADVRGAAAYAFSDFGSSHTVLDQDGEPAAMAIVTGVDAAVNPEVAGLASKPHTIGSDCWVVLSGDFPATLLDKAPLDPDTPLHTLSPEARAALKALPPGTPRPLNDGVPRRVLSRTPFSFTIAADTSDCPPMLLGQATASTVKVQRSMGFKSLAERVVAPIVVASEGLINADMSKWARAEQLHAAFSGLEAWRSAHDGALPELRNAAQAEEVAAATRAFCASLRGTEGALQMSEEEAEAAADVARSLSLLSRAELPALAAFYGGLVAQEVLKITGKFTPLNQWFYFDSLDVLPAAALRPDFPAAEWSPEGSRLDNNYALYGRSLQAEVSDQRVFMVGAGALGCEMLKNYAMMGLGTGPKGGLTITDMDRIEVSNLSRQFLFRPQHVGCQKSSTAAAAVLAMNPAMKVVAREQRVGPESEGAGGFDYAFWSDISFVTNALDNVEARKYMDRRCMFFSKPLLESGTEGAKANVQVVVPHQTEAYSDVADAAGETIPMCTLRNFPYLDVHCIEWARDQFEGLCGGPVAAARAFAESPGRWLADFKGRLATTANFLQPLESVQGMLRMLGAVRGASFQSCVTFARQQFEEQFNHRIRRLQADNPPDAIDSHGNPFWVGDKRYPVAAEFDLSDPMHASYLTNTVRLVAESMGVALPAGWDAADALAVTLAEAAKHVPAFNYVPLHKRNVAAAAAGAGAGGGAGAKPAPAPTAAAGSGTEDKATLLASLMAELAKLEAMSATPEEAAALALVCSRLSPIEMEKDDDSNGHVDYMAAASNLRARNYRLGESDRYRVKSVVGRIIPAMATTTCAVTGLVTLEALRLIKGTMEAEAAKAALKAAQAAAAAAEAGTPAAEAAAAAVTAAEEAAAAKASALGVSARNSYISVAIHMYSQSEPYPPTTTKSLEFDEQAQAPTLAVPEGYTHWHKYDLRGDPTVADVEAWAASINCCICPAGIALPDYGTAIYAPGASGMRGRKDVPLRLMLENMITTLPQPPAALPAGQPYMVIVPMLDSTLPEHDGKVVVLPTVVAWF